MKREFGVATLARAPEPARGARFRTEPARPLTGIAAIALAICFNVPYALLAWLYDYPDILRRPAAEALERFDAGGPALVLVWYGFLLCAAALVPMAVALAVTSGRIAETPTLAIGAAVSGAIAGLAQAIGLARWVFVTPTLARAHAEGDEAVRIASESAYTLLNAYGGVGVGEHLGQLATALFVFQLVLLQWREGRFSTAALGIVSAVGIGLGTGEGLALALEGAGEWFGFATVVGFLALTAWLIATGIGLIRQGAPD